MLSRLALPLTLLTSICGSLAEDCVQDDSTSTADEASVDAVVLLQHGLALGPRVHRQVAVVQAAVDASHRVAPEREAAAPTSLCSRAQCLYSAPEALASAALVSAFCFLGWYAQKTSAAAQQESIGENSKDRYPIYDNAKFFCLIGIITSHFVNDTGDDGKFWHYPMPLDAWIGSVPLAGLSFLSGVMSKGRPSWSRCTSLLLAVLLPFLLYTVIFDGLLLPVLLAGHLELQVPIVLEQMWCASPKQTWYLQSLITWRLLTWAAFFLADRFGTRMWPVFIMLAMPLFIVSSFVSLRVWSLDNGVAFLPSFALGLLLPMHELLLAVPQSIATYSAGFGVVVLWTWCGAGSAALPLKDLHANLRGPCISLLSWSQGLLTGLSITAVFLLLLLLVCPRRHSWITHLGEASIYAYLLHTLALASWKAASPTTYYSFQVPAAVGFGLTVLLSSQPAQWFFMPIIEPRRCWSYWFASRPLMIKKGQNETTSASFAVDEASTGTSPR